VNFVHQEDTEKQSHHVSISPLKMQISTQVMLNEVKKMDKAKRYFIRKVFPPLLQVHMLLLRERESIFQASLIRSSSGKVYNYGLRQGRLHAVKSAIKTGYF